MSSGFQSLKVVIRCANLDTSRTFYTEVLGLSIVEQWEEAEGRGIIVSAGEDSPGALIEVYEMSPAGRRFDPRFREPVSSDKIDLQLHTPALEEWIARLRGRWPFQGPQDLPWGQRWIKLRDPDGLLIAIYTTRALSSQ
jgi:catechol 2,3-dioxygenase-like lactoylglutathione lyase family enzyme